MARSKVKGHSDHDITHLHPPNQCTYQVSTSYTGFLDTARKKFFLPPTQTPWVKIIPQQPLWAIG